MGKSSKTRSCPAVGHKITAAECGENRESRYACPADCRYNPFAPVNYTQFLEIDGTLEQKSLKWLFEESRDRRGLERRLQEARGGRSPHGAHALLAWELLFKRDEAGLTCANRWERAGLPGLKNDERVLLRARRQTRVVLLEVRRVLDAQRIEAVEVFAPSEPPRLVMDRRLAAQAVRFAPFVGWLYPLPHYWRLSGTVIVMPDLSPFGPEELVTELARHLGGPPAPPELSTWLAEHFARFDQALLAVALARRHQMFSALDAHFGKAVYELKSPFAECRSVLDEEPALDVDPLSDGERGEGFAEARAWFAGEDESLISLPEGGRVLRGRVLLGQSFWRVEAMGASRLADLRQRFEARLGSRVVFTGERRDDIGAMVAAKQPPYDAALVPPRLLERPQRLLFSTSRMPPLLPDESKEGREAEVMLSQDRAFLDARIPALNGETPRTAAADPALRPKLVRLLKARLRSLDEHNLRTGGTDDLNWLVRELGLTEILVDPPPRRAPSDPKEDLFEDDREEHEPIEEEDGDGEDRPEAPRLPAEPLTADEAAARLETVMDAFDDAEEALEELEASGSTLVDDLDELVGASLTEVEFSFLLTFAIQIWFALIPRGCAAPDLDLERMSESFRRELEGLSGALVPGPTGSMQRFLRGSLEPGLLQVVMGGLLNGAGRSPKKLRPSAEAQASMIVMLKVIINEIARTLKD